MCVSSQLSYPSLPHTFPSDCSKSFYITLQSVLRLILLLNSFYTVRFCTPTTGISILQCHIFKVQIWHFQTSCHFAYFFTWTSLTFCTLRMYVKHCAVRCIHWDAYKCWKSLNLNVSSCSLYSNCSYSSVSCYCRNIADAVNQIPLTKQILLMDTLVTVVIKLLTFSVYYWLINNNNNN